LLVLFVFSASRAFGAAKGLSSIRTVPVRGAD
jgi:hypothetical protein